MATIQDVVANLQTVGIFEFFLPFILIFAVVFGMLQKTKIFGDTKDPAVTKINAVIAFAFAAFILVFPTTSGQIISLSKYLGDWVGGTLIYIMGVITFIILVFMIATPLNEGKAPKFERAGLAAVIVAVVLVAALFLGSGGTQIFPGLDINLGGGFGGGGGFYFGGIDPSIIAIAVVFLIIAVAIWWVTKGD